MFKLVYLITRLEIPQSIVATSLGASVIEKHFTVNRSDGGPDSSFSLEPKEMCFLLKVVEKVSIH